MEFGSDYVYAPQEQKEEYEYVPESVFNHTAAADDDPSADDGEVSYCALLPNVYDQLLHCAALYRHAFWTYWTRLVKRSILQCEMR